MAPGAGFNRGMATNTDQLRATKLSTRRQRRTKADPRWTKRLTVHPGTEPVVYQPSLSSPHSRQSRHGRWSPVGSVATATALAGVLAISGAQPATASPVAAGSTSALSAHA